MKPLVSIIISTYNRQDLLPRAVESALSQNYENIEVIISDDCSQDSTQEVGERLAAENKKVKYFRNPTNLRTAGNWKKAFFEYSTGDLITVLNDDDEFVDNEFVSKAVDLFTKYEKQNIVCVFSDVQYENYYDLIDFYESSLSYGEDAFKEFTDGMELSFGNKFIHTDNGAIYKREALLGLNLFEHDIFTLDVEMMYKLMSVGGFGYLNTPSYKHNFDVSCLSKINSRKFVKAMQSVKWIELVYEFYRTKFGDSQKIVDWYNKRAEDAWKSLLYRVEFDMEDYIYFLINNLKQNACIYIYGTGMAGGLIFKVLSKKRSDIDIAGFIDDSKNGYFENKKIFQLSEINTNNDIVIAVNDYVLAYKLSEKAIGAGCKPSKIKSIINKKV